MKQETFIRYEAVAKNQITTKIITANNLSNFEYVEVGNFMT